MQTKYVKSSIAAALVCLSLSAPAFSQTQIRLDLENVSVSGLSSGGYMATQYQLAYGESVVGAGIVAAGPFYCARNSISTALAECVTQTTAATSNQELLEYIQQQQAAGKLATAEQIADQRVIVLHGTLDQKINRAAVDLLVEQYQTMLNQAPKYIHDKAFAHLLPTTSYGSACDVSESPFLGACEFDAAGEILQYIYPELQPPVDVIDDNIVTLSQQDEYTVEGAELDEIGYAYVPTACTEGELCQVHISFHGCNQSAQDVGLAYVKNSGFNRWAESNAMIIVYPQVKKSTMFPMNPQGCWDWWGYTGVDYATNSGKQLRAIHALVESLPTQLTRK